MQGKVRKWVLLWAALREAWEDLLDGVKGVLEEGKQSVMSFLVELNY